MGSEGEGGNMSDNKYTKIYTLPTGEEIGVLESYEGRYISVLIQRMYVDEKRADKNQPMAEKWAKCDCAKIEKSVSLFDRESHELFYAIDTSVVAEDKNWVEYPNVSYYEQQCSNTRATTKVEIILQVDEFSRRLFKEWSGNTSCYDLMQGLAEELWEEFCEGKHGANISDDEENNDLIRLEMYTNKGESCPIEFEGERVIEDAIVSVRVIEFKNEIIKE